MAKQLREQPRPWSRRHPVATVVMVAAAILIPMATWVPFDLNAVLPTRYLLARQSAGGERARSAADELAKRYFQGDLSDGQRAAFARAWYSIEWDGGDGAYALLDVFGYFTTPLAEADLTRSGDASAMILLRPNVQHPGKPEFARSPDLAFSAEIKSVSLDGEDLPRVEFERVAAPDGTHEHPQPYFVADLRAGFDRIYNLPRRFSRMQKDPLRLRGGPIWIRDCRAGAHVVTFSVTHRVTERDTGLELARWTDEHRCEAEALAAIEVHERFGGE